MLVHLHVKNLALIEDIEVEFGPGLNILTGETRAGKSRMGSIACAGTASVAKNIAAIPVAMTFLMNLCKRTHLVNARIKLEKYY